MRTIYKFTIVEGEVLLPVGAVILDVAEQNAILRVWCEVDTDKTEMVLRKIVLVGTGQRIPTNGEHIKTIHMPHEVWHVYEVV